VAPVLLAVRISTWLYAAVDICVQIVCVVITPQLNTSQKNLAGFQVFQWAMCKVVWAVYNWCCVRTVCRARCVRVYAVLVAAQSNQWYSWGPVHMQCRLCASCWIYWKKYGGLKMPTRLGTCSTQHTQTYVLLSHFLFHQLVVMFCYVHSINVFDYLASYLYSVLP